MVYGLSLQTPFERASPVYGMSLKSEYYRVKHQACFSLDNWLMYLCESTICSLNLYYAEAQSYSSL